jgi:hypothetical protein
MTITSMRSHCNKVGQILLVLPTDVIGPFRNALQKLVGGVDFLALDAAERSSLDEALRHLWNPGDDPQPGRERTVPIEVLALTMHEPRASALLEAALPQMAAASWAQFGLETSDGVSGARAHVPEEAEPSPPSPPSPGDLRPTVELSPRDLPASPLPASDERTSATRSDGYRAPTKGRHTDVSR